MSWPERLDEALIGFAICEHLDTEARASLIIGWLEMFAVFT
jgi:hypothetical protein